MDTRDPSPRSAPQVLRPESSLRGPAEMVPIKHQVGESERLAVPTTLGASFRRFSHRLPPGEGLSAAAAGTTRGRKPGRSADLTPVRNRRRSSRWLP
jgi:hypothetical protein